MFKSLKYINDYGWILEDSDFSYFLGEEVNFGDVIKAILKIYTDYGMDPVPQLFQYFKWRNTTDEQEVILKSFKSDIESFKHERMKADENISKRMEYLYEKYLIFM